MATAADDRPASPEWRRNSAHCAAKQTSAIIATVRPTATLDSHESTTTMRWTSARGKTDRNAHPNTNGADSQTCRQRTACAGSLPSRRTGITAASTHAQMLTTLIADSAIHHAFTLIAAAKMPAGKQSRNQCGTEWTPAVKS